MFGCNFLESCYFLMKDTKGVVLEGREGKKEMRGAEGEETIMRNTLYEERITFNKKRKNKIKNIREKLYVNTILQKIPKLYTNMK